MAFGVPKCETLKSLRKLLNLEEKSCCLAVRKMCALLSYDWKGDNIYTQGILWFISSQYVKNTRELIKYCYLATIVYGKQTSLIIQNNQIYLNNK